MPADLADEQTAALVARLSENHTFSFVIRPQNGQLLKASTVGGTLCQMERLLKACAKDHDAKATVLVKDIRVVDGTITFDLLVMHAERYTAAQPRETTRHS